MWNWNDKCYMYCWQRSHARLAFSFFTFKAWQSLRPIIVFMCVSRYTHKQTFQWTILWIHLSSSGYYNNPNPFYHVTDSINLAILLKLIITNYELLDDKFKWFQTVAVFSILLYNYEVSTFCNAVFNQLLSMLWYFRTNTEGYFVVGTAAGSDRVITSLRRGNLAAVGLYHAKTLQFPAGTHPTKQNLVDAVVTSTSFDNSLAKLLLPEGQGGVEDMDDEASGVPQRSISRCFAKSTKNMFAFWPSTPTPGLYYCNHSVLAL